MRAAARDALASDYALFEPTVTESDSCAVSKCLILGIAKAVDELSRQSYSLTEKLYAKLGGHSEENA